MINWKKLFISILIPNTLGFLGSLLGNVSGGFNEIVKPSFTPPAIIFPIVWTILYVLLGISSYLVYESNSEDKNSSIIIYGIGLILNSLWTLFFFRLKWFLFSFILILLILFFVIWMIIKYYRINKVAAFLQIPYVFWLIFAVVLSFNVYLLN